MIDRAAAQPLIARKRRLRILMRFAQSLGVASLILVMNFGEMLGGGDNVRLHAPYRLTGIVFAQIADILLLGLFFFAAIGPLQRTRLRPWVRLLITIAVPPYLFARNRALFPFGGREGLVAIIAALWASLLLLLMMVFPRWYSRVLRFGDAVGIVFAVFALSGIAQLLWLLRWTPKPQQFHSIWAQTQQPPRTHPRVVWIVFDELSYDQLFEHRAHDLELPSFDALRAISTLYTDVQPAGLKTVKIIPSLLTGRTVDDFRFSSTNLFRVHYEGVRGWHPLTGADTLFADARNAGWRTAAVGWYNPYCTVYADALDECYWTNLDKFDGPMAQRQPFWLNVFGPLQQLVREIKSPTRADRDNCTFDVRQRLQTHLDLEHHAFDLLSADQADFVFLHLAVPHSPNIWSRADDNYTRFCDSSYLDNLALADREVGRVLATLKASPRWKDTTLIVQGDHSWRIQLWNWLPAWTDEDDHASRGEFDPRPALLIHQAGQAKPATVATPWPLLQVHQVIAETLNATSK